MVTIIRLVHMPAENKLQFFMGAHNDKTCIPRLKAGGLNNQESKNEGERA
jgi:hypothetical protein